MASQMRPEKPEAAKVREYRDRGAANWDLLCCSGAESSGIHKRVWRKSGGMKALKVARRPKISGLEFRQALTGYILAARPADALCACRITLENSWL